MTPGSFRKSHLFPCRGQNLPPQALCVDFLEDARCRIPSQAQDGVQMMRHLMRHLTPWIFQLLYLSAVFQTHSSSGRDVVPVHSVGPHQTSDSSFAPPPSPSVPGFRLVEVPALHRLLPQSRSPQTKFVNQEPQVSSYCKEPAPRPVWRMLPLCLLAHVGPLHSVFSNPSCEELIEVLVDDVCAAIKVFHLFCCAIHSRFFQDRSACRRRWRWPLHS